MMRILIVGGGKTAEEVIKSLDLKKNTVYVVETRPERREAIMSKYDVVVISKDARDPSLYANDINMGQIDMVLALTDSDETNILVLAISKIYNVPHRIARVNDRQLAELVRQLGLGIPITQPCMIASLISNYISTISNSVELTSFTVGESTYYIHLVTIAETDYSAGSKVEELERRASENGVFLKVLLIFDNESFRVPKSDEEIKPGYQLIILSSAGRDSVDEIIKG